MSTEETVSVVLSAAAIAAVNGQPVSIHGSLDSATFLGNTPTPVSELMWRTILSKQQINGVAMFEVAPAAAAADAAPASTATASTKKSATVSSSTSTDASSVTSPTT